MYHSSSDSCSLGELEIVCGRLSRVLIIALVYSADTMSLEDPKTLLEQVPGNKELMLFLKTCLTSFENILK